MPCGHVSMWCVSVCGNVVRSLTGSLARSLVVQLNGGDGTRRPRAHARGESRDHRSGGKHEKLVSSQCAPLVADRIGSRVVRTRGFRALPCAIIDRSEFEFEQGAMVWQSDRLHSPHPSSGVVRGRKKAHPHTQTHTHTQKESSRNAFPILRPSLLG